MNVAATFVPQSGVVRPATSPGVINVAATFLRGKPPSPPDVPGADVVVHLRRDKRTHRPFTPRISPYATSYRSSSSLAFLLLISHNPQLLRAQRPPASRGLRLGDG